jgi:hypothetical protein
VSSSQGSAHGATRRENYRSNELTNPEVEALLNGPDHSAGRTHDTALGPMTNCSHSWRPSNYAELSRPAIALTSGITGTSAYVEHRIMSRVVVKVLVSGG